MVGTATLGRRGDDWILWKLYVSLRAQRDGLGTALLQTAVRALPAGTPSLPLSYIAGYERAAAFDARQGFEHVGAEADPNGWNPSPTPSELTKRTARKTIGYQDTRPQRDVGVLPAPFLPR